MIIRKDASFFEEYIKKANKLEIDSKLAVYFWWTTNGLAIEVWEETINDLSEKEYVLVSIWSCFP